MNLNNVRCDLNVMRNSIDALIMKQIGESIETFQGMKDELEKKIPSQWESERGTIRKTQ